MSYRNLLFNHYPGGQEQAFIVDKRQEAAEPGHEQLLRLSANSAEIRHACEAKPFIFT